MDFTFAAGMIPVIFLVSDSDGVSSAVIHNQAGKILLFMKY
ncbi:MULTISPECIES: hypothetical protein [unclassified Paenibacillus]|nr:MULTISPECIES: hypothetical protein [unclassified Paenibacillus]